MITVGFNKIFVDENIALGNHMFQYAICRMVAEKNGYNFFIPYPGHLDRCFPGIDLGISDGFIIGDYNDSHSQFFNPEIFNVQNFTNLNGYYQTEKYFHGYEEKIRDWFKCDLDDKTKGIIEKYPIEEYCYIHLRGGDNKFGNNNWLMSKEYYLKAMDEVRKVKSDINFLIITDDLDLSKIYFPEIDCLSNDVMTDFKCLYFSKYIIIPASTFSWWPAWLTEKNIVVAPNYWLNYNKDINEWYPIDIKTEKFTYITK